MISERVLFENKLCSRLKFVRQSHEETLQAQPLFKNQSEIKDGESD